MLQAVDEPRHVFLGVESQPVHACVKFYVNGIARDSLLACGTYECFKQSERIDLRLKFIVEHRLERGHLGVHNHDIRRDSRLAQSHSSSATATAR